MMNLPRGPIAGLLVVSFALGLLAPTRSRGEPPNLSSAKAAVERYIDSGEYIAEVGVVCNQASEYLAQRARGPAGKLAVVFDLDETLLSNIGEIRGLDFGYQKKLWDAWVAEGSAPPLLPVKHLYEHVRMLGFEVILLSGRREGDRVGTEKNLRADGYTGYSTLVLMPDARQSSVEAFKTDARAALTRQGYVIVANIGDQVTDLRGGYAEKTFKIPDPFYIVK